MLQNLYFDILMVEDCETDAELTKMAIQGVDDRLKVFHLWDGEEAMNWIEHAPFVPKLILLDIKMPKISGIEVLETIRQHNAFSQIPVIITTSSFIPSDEEICHKLGAHDFVTKPLDLYGYLDSFGKAIANQLAVEFQPMVMETD